MQNNIQKFKTIIIFAGIFLGIFCFIKISQAATHEVTNCTVANVQDAVEEAIAGEDSVYLNCASATWDTYVTITKGITIYGNGPTSTTITANNSALFNITLVNTDNFRMHDIGFTGTGGGLGLDTTLIRLRGTGDIGISAGTIWNSLRMDHLKFTNVSYGTFCFTIDIWNTIPYHPKALFDNITYTNTGPGAFIKIAGNNFTWTEADQYGTDYAIFIEDSTFYWSTPAFYNYLTDTEHGVRMVVRYNTFTNGSIQMHDTGSTPAARGNRIAEVYNNTFNCTGDCSSMLAIAMRGGGYIIHDNTIAGSYWTPGFAQIYRTTGPGYLGGACNGTPLRACNTDSYYHCTGGDKKWTGSNECSGKGSRVVACTSNFDCPIGVDGTATCLASIDNVDGGTNAFGYPCRDQTGWGQEYGTGGRYQYPSPVYWYNNGTDASCATGGTCNNSATIAGANNWFQVNRDFCYYSPVTDDCGAKTAWTYTPYTYPHPLQGGSTPQTCGNNVKEGTEVCDGTDLASQTCISRGFTGGTLACSSGCASFNTSGCTSYFQPEANIEAESGTLTGMQTGVSGSDTYVYASTDNTGSASFAFNIQNPGQYKIEARVNNNNDGGQNSFFVGLDSEPAQGNVYYTYHLFPLQTGFYWDNVSRWGNGQTGDPPISEFDPMIWTLSQGTHTLTFYGREANTWLDQIILKRVTTDTTPPAAPSGVRVN